MRKFINVETHEKDVFIINVNEVKSCYVENKKSIICDDGTTKLLQKVKINWLPHSEGTWNIFFCYEGDAIKLVRDLAKVDN